MKGTQRRSPEPALDADIAAALSNDPKERSENIMAVDVARHDLSRIAAPGSVVVDELCGVKTYATVHQLVSTVRSRLREGFGPGEVLRATFPMASMTGAPKRRAMQLIEEVEDMRRGLFSGTLGFFLPDGTADLNVVIRTMTFNAATGHASLITGGAITAGSDPEQEWEECELKARSVLNAFGHAG
jgi:para-aminobenzoate synthetase component 1